jgi:hypothetical protein
MLTAGYRRVLHEYGNHLPGVGAGLVQRRVIVNNLNLMMFLVVSSAA